MKAVLLLLAIFAGVTLSYPVDNKVDYLIEDLIKVLAKRQNTNGGTASDAKADRKAIKPDKEDLKKVAAITSARRKELRFFAKVCGFDVRQEAVFTPVSMHDVRHALRKVLQVFKALSNRFELHKDVLAKVEEMKEDNENLTNHKALMDEFKKIPDAEMMKEVTCAIGGLKLLIGRAKEMSLRKKDFPQHENCHDTCAQLVPILMNLGKQQGLPEIDPKTVQANVEADYKCIRSHVDKVRNFLEDVFDNHLAEEVKPEDVDAEEGFALVTAMEH